MFTVDGELREGFEDSTEAEAPDVEAPAVTVAPAATEAPRPSSENAPPVAPVENAPPVNPERAYEAPDAAGAPQVDLPPDLPPDASPYGSPGFLDLVAMLAEPIAIYLGDAQIPGGGSSENLELARMHIDLLEVVKEKTQGNLSSQELTILDDILYRLRMRYVEKRG